MSDTSVDDKVVRLPTQVAPAAPATPSSIGGPQGAAISGMALCALIGIATTFALITVTWPPEWRRYVTVAFVASIVGFLTCSSIALFAAARATHPRRTAADENIEIES